MPKFNSFKIVNLKYSDNGRRLMSDNLISAKGEHLQVEAKNSCGKTVVIQTLIQPIIPLADVGRKAIDLYTIKEPVYSMIEWILDDNKTKLITGIGFERKASLESDDNTSGSKSSFFKYFTFTIEEDERLGINLDNLEIYKVYSRGGKYLKSLYEMEEYIKHLKHISPDKVNVFGQDSKKYKQKLEEYGIHQEEWKDINLKINKDESNLPKFFETANTTEKLLKNKILPLIENSLSDPDSKETGIKQLRGQVENFVNFCIEMDEKIQSYNDFNILLNYTKEMQEVINQLDISETQKAEVETTLAEYYSYAINKLELIEEQKKLNQDRLQEIERKEKYINFELESYELENLTEHAASKLELIDNLDLHKKELESKYTQTKEDINILEYQRLHKELNNNIGYIADKEASKEKLSLENEEISKQVNNLGYSINKKLSSIVQELEDKRDNISSDIKDTIEEKEKLETTIEQQNSEIKSHSIELNVKKGELNQYNNSLDVFISNNNDIEPFITRTLYGQDVNYTNYIESVNDDIKKYESKVNEYENSIKELNNEINNLKLENSKSDLNIEQIKNNIEKLYTEIYELENFEESLDKLAESFDINREALVNTKDIFKEIKYCVDKFKDDIQISRNYKSELDQKRNILTNTTDISIDSKLQDELDRLGIDTEFGFNHLINLDIPLENKEKMIRECPILPYSIIVSRSNYEKLKKKELQHNTKFTTPIIIREDADNINLSQYNNIISDGNINLLMSFDMNLLDKEKRQQDIKHTTEEILKVEDKINFLEARINKLDEFKYNCSTIQYSVDKKESKQLKLHELENELEEINYRKIDNNKEITIKTHEIDKLSTSIHKCNEMLESKKEKLNEIKSLYNQYDMVKNHERDMNDLKDEIDNIETELKNNKSLKTKRENDLLEFNVQKTKVETELNDTLKLLKEYTAYNTGFIISGELNELLSKIASLKSSSVVSDLEELNKDIANAKSTNVTLQSRMDTLSQEITSVNDVLSKVILYSESELKEKLEKLIKPINEKNKEIEKATKDYDILIYRIKTKRDDILQRYNRQPLDIDKIEDFDFDKRISDVKAEEKSVIDENKELDELKNTLSAASQTLERFKKNNVTIKNFDNIDLFQMQKEGIDKLYDIEKTQKDLNARINNIHKNINEFDATKNNKYKIITQNFNMQNIGIKSHIEILKKVELHLENDIRNVEEHKKSLDNEKALICRKTQEYLKDCINELREFNKLGKHNGQTIFEIKLPKNEDINYNVVNTVIEDLHESKDVSKIEMIINSYYLIDKLIGMGTIKIRVLKYELNNVESLIPWDRVGKICSGGQTFCVSFIVLTMLMEYKRNTVGSLQRNLNSKVLLMDNPFGKTSEEGFLKKTFELAEKFNVQIISYTHIKAMSIRERFNIIYTMDVRNTTSGKELVVLEEDKTHAKTKEYIKTSEYSIQEHTLQEDFFATIQ